MRKLLCMLLCLLLLCPAAQAQSYTVSWGDWGSSQFGWVNFMFSDEGKIIVTNEEYCSIYAISSQHGWFSATLCERTAEGSHQPGGEALMDADGNVLTGHIYSDFEAASADMIIAVQEDSAYNRLYSVLNSKGEAIVPPQEAPIALLGDELCYTSGENNQIILVYKDGSRTAMEAYLPSDAIDDAIIPLLPAAPAPGGKFGYVDPSGNWIVAPEYSSAGYFYETSGGVYANADGGLVDTLGRQIVPGGYEQHIINRNAILAKHRNRDACDIYSLSGELLFSRDDLVQLFGDYFCIPESGVLLDMQGNEFAYDTEKFEPVSDEWYSPSDVALLRDRETGYVSLLLADGSMLHTKGGALSSAGNGIFIESYTAEANHPGSGNCACSLYETRYALIDIDSNRILPDEFYQLFHLEGTPYYIFEDETGYGVIDENGAVLLYNDLGFNRHVQVWG